MREPKAQSRPHAILPMLTLLLLVVSCCWLAVATPAKAERLQTRLYSEDDGLSSLSITAIAQDHQGYLWVGTENGLFRYTGSSFREFGRREGFHEPAIYSLLVDPSGTVWAGTHTGLFWLGDGIFHEVRVEGRSIRVGMNNMLAASPAGELVVQEGDHTFSVMRTGPRKDWTAISYGDRHPAFPRFGEANGVGIDGAGHLWMGCEEAICLFDGAHTRTLGPAEGVPRDYYMSLFRARDGQLWARGRKHILAWRPGDRMVRDLSSLFPPGGMLTIHRRFTEDAWGRILAPTASGFATWNGTRWEETVLTSQGPIFGATELFSDAEGSVWIGTEGNGLLQTEGYGRWTTYGTESGLSSQSVAALARSSNGDLWLGNNLALSRMAAGTQRIAPTPLGLGEESLMVQSLAPDGTGGIWVGSLVGKLAHISANGRVDVRTSIEPYIYGLLLVDGTLWLGTSDGLYRARCQAGAPCKPVQWAGDTLGNNAVRSLAPDGRGGFWAAGTHGLDHLLDGGVLHVRVRGQRQNFTLVAFAGRDQVWLAGEGAGFLRARVEDGDAEMKETHTQPELLSDRMQFLAPDGQGRLWIGTDHGVDVLAGGRVTGLTTEDGLSSNNAVAFLADGDGSVWIGTTAGASHLLDPPAILARKSFRARIDQLVYHASDAGDLLRIGPGAPLKLGWKPEPTVIRFSAETFRENHALIYHYRLLGLENAETVTGAPLARYERLAPGAYTFVVVAEDPVHHVFSTPARLTFTLVPPWYKSRRMYVPMVLLCFGLLNLVWHSSHRLLLAQQRKLERLVEARTREIEKMSLHDSLTGVLNRKAIMARLEEEMEYARRHNTPLSIALIDLDHFKQINDTLGHLAGDEVLRESARRLAASVRTSDTIGRYGGEEFILLFRNVDRAFGLDHCERVRQQLCQEPVCFGAAQLVITCSIGLAWSRDVTEFTPALIARADEAMYRAKQKGRNRVECAGAEEETPELLALQ